MPKSFQFLALLGAIFSLSVGEVVFAADFNVSSTARIRYESKSNQDFLDAGKDYTSSIGSRIRVNITLKQADKYELFFQPQFAKTWGALDSTSSSTSGALNDTELEVHQAYLNYSKNESLQFRVGRQELSYGDQLVIGEVGWSNIGRSFDAFKLVHQCGDNSKMDLFFSSLVEGSVSTPKTGSKDLAGLYWSTTLNEKYAKNSDVYYFQLNDHSTAVENNISTYGLRLKSDLGLFDYRLEATWQDQENDSANQADIELGHDLPLSKPMRISLEYFVASKTYNQLFPTGHKWLGYADMFSRKNISGYNIQFSNQLTDKLKSEISYHQFLRTDKNVDAYNFSGTAFGSVGDESNIASEIDLTLAYKESDFLSYAIGGSQVTPGQYLKDNGKVDDMGFLYVQVLMSL